MPEIKETSHCYILNPDRSPFKVKDRQTKEPYDYKDDSDAFEDAVNALLRPGGPKKLLISHEVAIERVK